MGSFTLKPATLTLLLGLLAVITLVLVLPQVDLDFAFPRGTSPFVARARATSPPLVLIVASPMSLGYIAAARQDRGGNLPPYDITQSLHILEHSLRC